MKIAVFNAGSSSLKVKVFDYENKALRYSRVIERIGEQGSAVASHEAALQALDLDFASFDIIGHRVVHGGEHLQKSHKIDAAVIEQIRSLIVLAPLHNPANLRVIELTMQKAANVPQVAVFDTAFHATMPPEAFLYALPYRLYEKEGIRRYGFHGTSHGYLVGEAAKILNKDRNSLNLITLHLGNGASACAVKNGKSIDTSMGFTPLEGLVMGTRCGDLDPEILLYLQNELGMSTKEVARVLNKESGLYGLCGENDVRSILQREDERAALALRIMVRRIQKYIGAYMVLLERVDAIIFSGGVGENSEAIRNAVMDNALLQRLPTLVIPTQEEWAIAQESYDVLFS